MTTARRRASPAAVFGVLCTLGPAGCSFDPSGLTSRAGDGGGPGDAAAMTDGGRLPDGGALDDGGPRDGSPGPDAACEGDRYPWLSNLGRCDVPEAGPRLDLAGGTWRIDTATGMLRNPGGQLSALPGTALVTQLGGGMVRVTSTIGVNIAAGTRVDVVGAYPLIIVARGDIAVDGQLDAGAVGAQAGAGGRSAVDCATQAGRDGEDSVATASGGAGGGGASFQGQGGNGGAGQAAGGGARGVRPASFTPVPLRGGCPGGVGGAYDQAAPDAAAVGGAGGGGGGALQLSSGGSIVTAGGGWITVSGGGGRNGGVHNGGGGGGSGGSLLLEAATAIRTSGTLTANGGGGASGGGSSSSDGAAGADGSADGATSAGGGDCGLFCDGGPGGAGGAGGALDGSGGSGGNASGGGAGGGGGVGVIVLRSPSIPNLGLHSPASTRTGL
ncbi:MAG: hypothetical protein IT370_21725 [Deltaproteobacteria bacterium]|nr:hypothetical protein [Deltaproteobacteria bacterium]